MARSFNGSSDYMEATSAVAAPAPLTVCGWAKPSSYHDGYLAIECHTTGSGRYGLRVDSSQYVVADHNSGVPQPALTTAKYSLDVWQHMAAVFYSGHTARSAFLNGGNKGTNSVNTGTPSVNRTRIGNRTPTDYFFDGLLAEIAIWDVALADYEIALLATGLNPLCSTSRIVNLVLYQDLIRSPNRPGIGPNVSITGTTVADHPRIIAPIGLQAVACGRASAIGGPYCVGAAGVWSPGATSGNVLAAGNEEGELFLAGAAAGEVHC